jgi:hypothetical protein
VLQSRLHGHELKSQGESRKSTGVQEKVSTARQDARPEVRDDRLASDYRLGIERLRVALAELL